MNFILLLRRCAAILLLIFSFTVKAVPGDFETISRGTLLLNNEQGQTSEGLTLDTRVSVDIAGLTARVKVVQNFKNDSANWMEGQYLFPLPEKSAVDTLRMKIGQRVIEGEIKEKTAAKKIYQAAKLSGRKASLVEQKRPNLFVNSVTNIGPFESIEVTIEYQQDLVFDRNHGLSLRFPMTMTPRYSPVSKVFESYQDLKLGFQFQPSFFSEEVIQTFNDQQAGGKVYVDVKLNSGIPLDSVSSQSHKIVYQQQSESQFTIALEEGSVKPDRDFVLSWKPVRGAEPRAAYFSQSYEKQHFISLMIMPPAETDSARSLSREVIFVIDTSGSMAGESIEQAKSALKFGLETLKTGDRFNIIEFNSHTESLFTSAQEFNVTNRRMAVDFMDRLNANGGTEMVAAMQLALDGKSNATRVRQVLFLTDGAISNEAELFQQIEHRLGDSRLFTVGIGSAPNEFFMKRAARFGRGTFTFIADVGQAENQIRSLLAQISQPVLTDIAIEWPEAAGVEMWPDKVADLFAGEPLWVKARVDQYGGELNIKGRLADKAWQTQLSLDAGANQPGIAKLWAREKIAAIMDQSHHGRLSSEQHSQVTEVALKYHLVSRFTSLVAVDKTPARGSEPLSRASLPLARAKGSTTQLQFPKTALDYALTPKDACLLVLAALLGLLFVRRMA